MRRIIVRGLNADLSIAAAIEAAEQAEAAAGNAATAAAAGVVAATAVDRAAAQTARTGAEAARDDAEALVISDLGTTDGQTRALIEAPSSQTAAALSATIERVAKSNLGAVAWPLMHTLETESANLTLAVSGDSISANQDSWVNVLARELGESFPAWTIIQRSKTNGADTYGAPATVQTGTGPRTLTIYNWSQAGAGSGVGLDSDTVFNIAYPVAPDLFLIATGHNDFSFAVNAGNRAFLRNAVRSSLDRLTRRYPETPAAFVLMNPRTTDDPNYAAVVEVEKNKVLMAGEFGLGVLNLNQAWYDLPGGYDDLLYDTTHPDTAGVELLGTTAHRHLLDALKEGPTGGPRRSVAPESITIGAIGGAALVGTPAQASQAAYNNTLGVAFDPDATERWLLPQLILIPASWSSWNIEVMWCPQGTSMGNILWQVSYSAGGTGAVSRMGRFDLAPGTTTITGNDQAVTTYTNCTPIAPHIPSNFAHDGDDLTRAFAPMQFSVARLAADPGDTLPGDALLYGIRITRAA